jgi:hypothetical protein
MKATYDPTAKTKFTTSHRKEGKCYFDEWSIIDPTPREHDYCKHIARAPIVARMYGTGNRNFCCIWINYDGLHVNASGYAGGYGYHRPSAAMEDAIRNSGFTLDQAIGGVGQSAMEEALLTIAECIGIKNPILHHAHA